MPTKKSSKKGATKARPSRKKAAPRNAKKASKTASKTASQAKKKSREPIDRLREICLSLPETAEVEAWGSNTFRVKGKIFAMHAEAGNSHTHGRESVWILSVSLEQDLMIRARPDRYFKPPYVGPSGWIGAYLDRKPPWSEIEELLRDAWRRRAPKRIAALLAE